MILDETGVVADGDQLMALIAGLWADQGRLAGDTLVATVMSNLGLARFLTGRGLRLQRTAVGDRYVVEAMRAGGYNLGGEQSGHVVMPAYATPGERMGDDDLRAWTDRLVRWCEALFRDAYHAVAEDDNFAQPPSAREPMLWAYLLDKTLYEVRYELGSRPHWAWIPLRGLRRLLQAEPPRTVSDAPATADA